MFLQTNLITLVPRLTPHEKVAAQTELIASKVVPELNAIFGRRMHC
jgi:hypothetical protein